MRLSQPLGSACDALRDRARVDQIGSEGESELTRRDGGAGHSSKGASAFRGVDGARGCRRSSER